MSNGRRQLGSPRGRALLGILLAWSLFGCGDKPLPSEPQTPVDHAVFRIQLLDALGLAPLDSVRLALLELESMRFAAQERSDDLGRLDFDPLAPGEYVPVVFGGDAALLPLPRPSWVLSAGDTASVGLRGARLSPGTAQLSGRVVDAVTGMAIEGAALEMESRVLLPELYGVTTLHRQLSDAEGRFALREFRILQLPGDGGALVPDLICHAPGYRALRRPVAFEELPLLGLRLQLQPGNDGASLRGRLVGLDGAPVSGVALALEQVSQLTIPAKAEAAPDPHAMIVQGAVAESEVDGVYHFTGLAPGFYRVAPGYRLNDGWLRIDGRDLPPGFSRPQISIAEDEEAQLGAIAVAPAIHPIAPAPEAVVGPQPDFAWEAWPYRGTVWATGYRIVVAPLESTDPADWLSLEPIEGETLPWPEPESFLPPGRHAWRVDAVGGQAQNLTLFEGWAHFEVRLPETTDSALDPADAGDVHPRRIRTVTSPPIGASSTPDGP